MKKTKLAEIRALLKDKRFEDALKIARKESKGTENQKAKAFINMGVEEGEKDKLENYRLASFYFRLAEKIAKDNKIKKNAKINQAIDHTNIGDLLDGLDKLEEAVVAYREAIKIDPTYAPAHYNLGVALVGLGKLGESVVAYREAIELDPTLAVAYYNLGNSLADLDKLEEAVVAYREAIKIDPTYAPAHYNLGSVLVGLGKLGESVVAYREAIELDPTYAPAHYNLGVALVGLGKLGESVVAYREAIKIDPTLAVAHNNLGVVLFDLGKLGESVVVYREAIKIDPTHAVAHFNLGRTLVNLGEIGEAESEYNKAIGLLMDSPKKCASVHVKLGELYLSLGDRLHDDSFYEDALNEFRDALKKSSKFNEDAELHNNMGYVFVKLKKLDDALTEFRESANLDHRDRKVKRNLRRIEKIVDEKQTKSKMQEGAYLLIFVVLCLSIALLTLNWNSSNFINYAGFVIALLVLLLVIANLPDMGRVKLGNFEFEKETADVTMRSPVISKFESSIYGRRRD